MLSIAEVKEKWRSKLPAITHVDGTSRLQTVSPDDEPRLARLLEAFKEVSGVPILLNTSFNRAGEPLVETPEDALKVFLATDLDLLIVGDYWIEKRSQ